MINKAVLQNILKSVNASKKPIAAVGGFHNGGLKIARTINDFGFKIVAVSDEEAGIVDLGGSKGFAINKLEGKRLSDVDLEKIKKTKPSFLLKMEVDVLVPENIPEVLNEENATDVRAKVVLQMSPRQITKNAEKILEEKQIPVIHLYS